MKNGEVIRVLAIIIHLLIFPIAVSDTSYNLILTSGSAWSGGICLAYNEKNIDKVKIYNYQVPVGDWQIKGY